MKRFKPLGFILLFAGLMILIASCDNDRPTENAKKKLLIVHARGLSYQDLANYLEGQQDQKFFRSQTREYIREVTPIVNAVTITNIASFETGKLPAEHGILGHTYAIRNGDSLQMVSGFSQRFAIETFWEQAAKAGKKVLNVGALILYGKHEQLEQVDCLAQGQQFHSSSFLELYPAPNQGRDTIILFQFLETGKHPLGEQYPFPIVAYKLTQDDGTVRNELILDTDQDITNGYLGQVKPEEWLEIEQTHSPNRKIAFRLKQQAESRDTIRLYLRPSYVNRGYPEEFVAAIDSVVGAATGWPNTGGYAFNRITASTLREEINREVDHVLQVFSHATSVKNYDLILLDYPLMDRYGHAYLQERDSSQVIQQYYQSAFARMDEDFYQLQQFAEENQYELLIVSGHGFSPIHTSIQLNQLLSTAGLETDQKKNNWEAFGAPGKVAAHIYLNPQLTDKEHAQVISKIEQVVQSIRTPEGQIFIDSLYPKHQLPEIGLNHVNAGDLFMLLKPGFVFQAGSNEELFGVPVFKGDHGYAPHYKESAGVMITNRFCQPCRSTDVATFILDKLNLN